MSSKPQPFTLRVLDADIDDLMKRLARTRLPNQVPNSRWEYGADLSYMRSLIEYWRTSFDWRAPEAKLNAFPQFKIPLAEIDVHYLYVPGIGPDPKPLLLPHGWPGSVFEFLDMIPRLSDPARFGGKAEDAFTVIAPSLPGYGLSFKPDQKRFTIPEIADCFAELMHSVLGFKRFGAQGGDWGSFTCSALGVRHPDKLAGIHLNMLSTNPYTSTPGPTDTADEQRYFEEIKRWSKEETGYIQIQGTRPQTLAYALTDSPAGLQPGLRRSSTPGRTMTATLRRWSPVTTCWQTYRSTGSPAPSAPHSGPTTTVSTGPGPSHGARPSMCRRDTLPFHARFAVPHAPSRRRITPTFVIGQ